MAWYKNVRIKDAISSFILRKRQRIDDMLCPSTTIFQHTIKEVLEQMIINWIISMESPIGSCER